MDRRMAIVDIVHELDSHEGYPNPSDMPMGGQSVVGPTGLAYDTPQNLILDHNRKMPHHTGETEHEAEFGNSLRELSNDSPSPQPLNRGEMWEQSYDQTSPVGSNYEGDPGSSIRMGSDQGPNLNPDQGELQKMVQQTGGRMLPIPNTPFGYLMDTDIQSSTIMLDSRTGKYFIGVPVEFSRTGQRQPWVAVDLDGTILEHPPQNAPEYGSTEQQLPFGAPQPGAAETLAELASLGWRISIYTARVGDENLDDETVKIWADQIGDHLDRHQIPYSDVWVGRKPRADYFVDDKAVAFEGDWADILTQLTVVGAEPQAQQNDQDVEVDEHEAGSDSVFGAGESENDWVDMSWGQRHPPAVNHGDPDLEAAKYGG